VEPVDDVRGGAPADGDDPARRIRHADEAYLAAPDELLELVHALGGRTAHVLLVGHNPGISQLAALLTGDHSLGEVPTSAVMSFKVPVKEWISLAPGAAERVLYDFPKNRP
jgi:phosphohistidine phosphatase